jgi:hypothetical protein
MADPGTAAEALEMYQAYVAAEKAILGGQSYAIAGRSLTRADLKSVREGRGYWLTTYKTLNRSGRALKGITPC